MSPLTHTSEFPATAPEQIDHFAEILKKSEDKRRIFSEIYKGQGKKPKSTAQIADKLGISSKRVAELATPLAHAGLFEIIKNGNRVSYRKYPHIATVRNKILTLARNPQKLAKHITVRKVEKAKSSAITIRLRIPKTMGRVKYITIEDIDNFKKASNIKLSSIPTTLDPAALQEKDFKAGLLKLLPGTDEAKDWGGEPNDIFTDKIYLNGKRVTAAIALKGPFAGTKITPGKMGTNGDQIQRLVASGAQVFLVQSEMSIAQSVYEQLEQLAKAKAALTNEHFYYGIINKADSYRLRMAYPSFFSKNGKP